MDNADKIKELAFVCFDLKGKLNNLYGKDAGDAFFNKMMSVLPTEVGTELLIEVLSGSIGSRELTITGMRRSAKDAPAVKVLRMATKSSLREAVDIMNKLRSGTSVNIALHESYSTVQAVFDIKTSLLDHFKL